jgi:hypothetical protein
MAEPRLPQRSSESADEAIEKYNAAMGGGLWNPNNLPPIAWLPLAEDYLSGLRLLRCHGWVVAIQASLGFALFQQRAADFSARLGAVLNDLDAYVNEGSNWIKQDWLYLFDPQRDTSDVSALGDRTLENLSARAPDYWNRCVNYIRANQNVYYPGKYPPLPHAWEVLRVDRLPSLGAYVGERDDRAAHPEVADLLGPLSLSGAPAPATSPTHVAAAEAAIALSVAEASHVTSEGRTPMRPSDESPTTRSAQPLPIASAGSPSVATAGAAMPAIEAPLRDAHGWGEIRPALERTTGLQLGSERNWRRLLKEHSIELQPRTEKRSAATLLRTDLEKLQRLHANGKTSCPYCLGQPAGENADPPTEVGTSQDYWENLGGPPDDPPTENTDAVDEVGTPRNS